MSIPNVTRLTLVIHFVNAIRFKQTIFARRRHAVILHSKKTLNRIAYSAGTFSFTTVISKPPGAEVMCCGPWEFQRTFNGTHL